MQTQKKNKNKFFAVYDISSSSIAGAQVLKRLDKNNKILISSHFRRDIILDNDIDIDHFLDKTITNLNLVIEKIVKTNQNTPEFIQIILSSPWYFLETRKILYQKEDPFVCTKKLIDKIVDEKIKEIILEKSNTNKLFKNQFTVVEKQLSAIKLNGYSSNTPFGKKTNSVELNIIVTFAPTLFQKRIKESFERFYGSKNIGYTTIPFSTYIVMREIKNVTDSVIIDIGEEMTDISFIKKGNILSEGSFPLGTYGLYKKISETKKHSLPESIALLESYRLKKLSEKSANLIEKSINSFSEDWRNKLRNIIDLSQYGFCLPPEIIVTADKRFEALICNIISNDPFIRYSCSYTKPNVTFINDALLNSEVKNSDETALDIPIANAALFVERLM